MAPPTVEVEIADLRGWSKQVGRASKDLGTAAHGYATGHIADADFGRILDVVTRAYGELIPKLHTILSGDGTGLDTTRKALDATATTYKRMDERSKNHFTKLPGGGTVHTVDDRVATGFDDVQPAAAKLVAPDDGGASLPVVSLGFPYDQICDLVKHFSDFDIRAKLTNVITGDIPKAARHASAWQHLGECTESVDANLDTGKVAIAKTWKGDASTASAGHLDKWGTALTEQGATMHKISKYLRSAIEQAVKMAQVIVDIVQTVISLVSAAWSCASIPAWGQWKLVKSVADALPMLKGAYDVIDTFWNAIDLISDTMSMIAGAFTMESLPPAPSTELPK